MLPKSFYRRDNVLQISKELLGKHLITNFEGQKTVGKIVETEAYRGPEDRACHAWNNRRTKRTETMFSEGGVAYVYLCYGIHHLFNVVTGFKDIPHAVLIRAVEPVDGIDIMLTRRKASLLKPSLTAGPGSLSKALGITTSHNAVDLNANQIWIEDAGISISEENIIASPRVGVAYAKEDALLPWRFRIKGSKCTSPAK